LFWQDRRPPFSTAHVADSQRSLPRDPLFKHALAQIAKGDGLTVSLEVTMDEFTPQEPGAAEKVIDGIQAASERVSDAIQTSRQPGMPLDTLARAVREAPLAALGIAFMLGVVFARPRR
jgi:hypothetical protein